MSAEIADRIKVLDVQGGDILVVRVEGHVLHQDAAMRIKGMVKAALDEVGVSCPVLVLDSSLKIEVLRPEPGKSPYLTKAELPDRLREIERAGS